ncbi:MAG: hypothetical protein K6C34_03265 [Alphaproteobacteria bacterium]|nr:hypothetical protein [Alphaproteobacteria bacterium]
MHNRFLKICNFLAACFFVTICNASVREDPTSDADKSRRKLRIVRPPFEYHVRTGNHPRIVERVPAQPVPVQPSIEDDELEGSLPDAESRETAEQMPIAVPRSITWRDSPHLAGSYVYMFRAKCGESEDIDGCQAESEMSHDCFTYRSVSYYPMGVKKKHDVSDVVIGSVKLAEKVFPLPNLDTNGFVSNHLALCPFDTDYSKFYPPFLTLPHNMTSSGVDALYFLYKGFGPQGSHEFALLLASCTRNIKTRTYIYAKKWATIREQQKAKPC